MSDAIQISPDLKQAEVDALEKQLLQEPQVECPLVHRFAPGLYAREVTMPAGTFIIGQRHKTSHFNVILSGKAKVMVGEHEVKILRAGDVLVSEAGIRKVLLILEEMRWMTIHPTSETDISRLEDELVIKSNAFLAEQEKKELRSAMEALKNHCESPADQPRQTT